jgi:flagellar hook-associated protein 1 FlgK
MSSSTFLGLNTAYTGLQAAQAGINTSAHNISNVNTEGYSRQQAIGNADKALTTHASYGTMGTGVVVNSIEKIRDSYYDIKYRNNNSNVGAYEVYENYMQLIEDYFDDYTLEGMTSEYNNFFEALNELYKNPNDATCKNDVINAGMSFADYFNTLYTNLQNIQRDVNDEIKNQCNRVNTIAQNIAELNKQINTVEVRGGNANDLRDQRDVLVDELSSIVNVKTSEQDMGGGVTYYTVQVNNQELVTNYNYNTLICEPKKELRNASDVSGMYEITWSNGLTFNEYSDSLNGKLKALLDIRDGCNNAYEVEDVTYDAQGNVESRDLNIITDLSLNTSYKGIPYYQSKINEFVELFATQVNDVFMQTAKDSDGNEILDAQGNPIQLAANADGVDAIPFFTVKYSDAAMGANVVEVNPDLVADNTLLATTIKTEIDGGYYVKGESESSLVKQLIKVVDEKNFNGGTGAYYLESIVSAVAIDSSKATNFLKNFNNISNSIDNQRLSVMGVDTDEEAMDLLKYQQAYNLSAHVMSVLQEVYDKLINGTGV